MSEDYTELIPNEVHGEHDPDFQSEPSRKSAGSTGGPAAGGGQVVGDEGWRKDKRGRHYIPRRNGKGILYQSGNESPQEALERDRPKDTKPRRSVKGHKPPPPRKADLKELEALLAEAFRSPAMICAGFGDVWAADHFTRQGPDLARNLVLAAEHNPWLRKKLENAATGGDFAIKLISILGLSGALFGYAVPPIIYWFNLPVPDRARAMFGIPDQRYHEDASSTPQAPPVAAAA